MSTNITEEIITKPEIIASDDRGVIEKIVGGDNYTTTLRITSKKGTVRANHYHQKDSHTCYLAKGQMEYVTREPATDESAPLKKVIINAGETFYTPPMIAHAMVFLEDSEFYAFTPRSGDQAEYENDVIRVELVSPEAAKQRAEGYKS